MGPDSSDETARMWPNLSEFHSSLVPLAATLDPESTNLGRNRPIWARSWPNLADFDIGQDRISMCSRSHTRSTHTGLGVLSFYLDGERRVEREAACPRFGCCSLGSSLPRLGRNRHRLGAHSTEIPAPRRRWRSWRPPPQCPAPCPPARASPMAGVAGALPERRGDPLQRTAEEVSPRDLRTGASPPCARAPGVWRWRGLRRGQHLAEIGPSTAAVAQQQKCGKVRAKLGRNRVGDLAKLDQHSAGIAQIWPNPVEVSQTSSELGRNWTRLGQNASLAEGVSVDRSGGRKVEAVGSVRRSDGRSDGARSTWGRPRLLRSGSSSLSICSWFGAGRFVLNLPMSDNDHGVLDIGPGISPNGGTPLIGGTRPAPPKVSCIAVAKAPVLFSVISTLVAAALWLRRPQIEGGTRLGADSLVEPTPATHVGRAFSAPLAFRSDASETVPSAMAWLVRVHHNL